MSFFSICPMLCHSTNQVCQFDPTGLMQGDDWALVILHKVA